MTTSKLIPMMIFDEGYRAKPYRDSRGFWTGGIGHLLSTSSTYPSSFNSYTHSDWLRVFASDLSFAEVQLDKVLGFWRKLSDPRQDVMVNLAFNLSAGKLATWKHTDADIAAGRFKAAAIDLLNDEPWASQVHDRAKRLANLMETGFYGDGNYPTLKDEPNVS